MYSFPPTVNELFDTAFFQEGKNLSLSTGLCSAVIRNTLWSSIVDKKRRQVPFTLISVRQAIAWLFAPAFTKLTRIFGFSILATTSASGDNKSGVDTLSKPEPFVSILTGFFLHLPTSFLSISLGLIE